MLVPEFDVARKLMTSLWWVRTSVAALTVSVASLLVAFPAELETTTLNCEPLSEVVVAAVV
jgi:hypothetical protein